MQIAAFEPMYWFYIYFSHKHIFTTLIYGNTLGVHRIVFFTIRPDTGYFCVEDPIPFFMLNSLKSGGGYWIVTIFKISLFGK